MGFNDILLVHQGAGDGGNTMFHPPQKSSPADTGKELMKERPREVLPMRIFNLEIMKTK